MKISLRRCHAPTVGHGVFSHFIAKKLFLRRIKILKDIKITLQVQELQQFCFKKLIFPIGQSGEASRWRVCYQWGLTRLIL